MRQQQIHTIGWLQKSRDGVDLIYPHGHRAKALINLATEGRRQSSLKVRPQQGSTTIYIKIKLLPQSRVQLFHAYGI